MELCNTDIKSIINLLDSGAKVISGSCQKPCDIDKARRMRIMSKKLKRKFELGTKKI